VVNLEEPAAGGMFEFARVRRRPRRAVKIGAPSADDEGPEQPSAGSGGVPAPEVFLPRRLH